MPKQYRYRPADNRTPVNHPTIGHLEYDGVYDSPDCAGNPDFEEIKSAKPKKTSIAKAAGKLAPAVPAKTEKARETAAEAEAEERGNAAPVGSPENPIVPLAPAVTADTPTADKSPSPQPADAGDTGRSNND